MPAATSPLDRMLAIAGLALPFLGPPALSFVGTSLLLSRLDLSALQGPASGQLILRLGLVEAGAPLSRVDRALVAWTELSPLVLLADLRLLGVLCASAAVFGACLAGHALAGGGAPGRHAATGCGLAMACCLPVVETSTWIAYDPLAIGLGMFSLGLAMYAAAGPSQGLLLVVPAVLGLLVAGEVREIALPLRALLPVLPLLAWRRPLRFLLLLGLLAWALRDGPALVELWMRNPALGPGQQLSVSLELESVRAGLERAHALLYHPDLGRHSLFLFLAVPAMVIGVIPGRLWAARLGLLALAAVGTGLLADALPEGWLRLRYLQVGSLSVVLLCGLGAGWCSWALRRAGPLSWAPALVLAGTLARDTLDGLWTSTREVSVGAGIAMPRLPRPRPWLFTLNGSAVGSEPHALAVDGATELWILVGDPPRPWASPPLQDERGAQVAAVATLSGAPGLVLSPEQCCPQGSASAECVERLLNELDAAGVDLVLPEPIERDWRFAVQDQLARTLRSTADEAGRVEIVPSAWAIVRARGSGGALPCRRRPLQLRDPRPTPEEVRSGAWWAAGG
jgi:hypothetical protein